MKKTLTTRKIVLTALLAALTYVSSSMRITIPLDIGGTTSFHLGNVLCTLSGLLLGPWLGGLAAGLGSMLYDMLNPLYLATCWMTFLMKGACGLVSGLVVRLFSRNWGYWKAVFATAAGAITYGLLYLAKTYFCSGLLLKGLEPEAALLTVVAKLPATIINAVAAVVIAPVLAVAIQKALKKQRLFPD